MGDLKTDVENWKRRIAELTKTGEDNSIIQAEIQILNGFLNVEAGLAAKELLNVSNNFVVVAVEKDKAYALIFTGDGLQKGQATGVRPGQKPWVEPIGVEEFVQLAYEITSGKVTQPWILDRIRAELNKI